MKLLHKQLQNELPFVHKTRLSNLMSSASTVIQVNKLTLTSLGRNFPKQIKTRNKIKKIDRLLGNSHLQKEAGAIYKAMNSHLLAESSQPWIHVDWSCVCATTNMYFLRASLSLQGRSIVIYEECHPKSGENNHAVHKSFLNALKTILPESVAPVIVTDAGFRGLWFSHVLKLGWHFVGRLRNKNAIKLKDSSEWTLSKSLYEGATGNPKHLGEGVLTQKGQVPASFVLYKEKPKYRRYKARSRRIGGGANKYVQSVNEPWLLVTSISGDDVAKQTINIYRQRMRIEENFRDTKCTRYGFGLKDSLTYIPERMKILLLIAAIATLACWLAGIFTREQGKAHEFQAQSAKHSGILSLVFLGREALKAGMRIGKRQLEKTLKLLLHLS
ncbi:MAG: IS4 family transposase, partial [Cytophagales bacterium]|nr:IS4 family transposase [Cytophagales bacterium]